MMNHRSFIRFFICLSFCVSITMAQGQSKQKKVLVFSKTAVFRHDSAISEGKKLFQALAKENDFQVDTTENAALFTAENIAQYDAIVFLCTSGPVFDDQQKQDFKTYIEGGGGFMGIHAASTTEYDWPWYGELVGAYFKDHPPGKVNVRLHIRDHQHPATRSLPAIWAFNEEIYNFKWMAKDLNVLITVDENSYKGGTHGEYHPLSWYHTNSGGRAFYTALGHDEKSYQDPLLIAHILGGLNYVLGR